VIDFVMRRSVDQNGGGIPWKETRNLADLDFADDVALLGSTQEDLRTATEALQNESATVGLRISSEKTKILRIGYARSRVPIMIDQQRAEEVDSFAYLGSIISNDGVSDRDAGYKIGKATGVLRRLQPIWSSASLSTATRMRLFNSIVVPTALCASETWRSTSTITRRLNVLQQRGLRRILRVSYQDRVTNEEILRRAGARPLADVVAERRVRFAGHILRLPSQRPAKIAMS